MTSAKVLPSQETIEKVKDNELIRINCENHLSQKLFHKRNCLNKMQKRRCEKTLRKIFTLYRQNAIVPMEFKVKKCIKDSTKR